MKKLFASLMIVFYTLASNTLAHSFAMNKITTHDSDHQTVHCPYHAQESSHADHNPNSTSSDGPKECYESCLGGYDKLSHTVINPDSYDRQHYDWSDLFHVPIASYQTERVTFPSHKILSHAPPDARQCAKMTKKLE